MICGSLTLDGAKRLLAKGLHKTLAASPDVDDYYKYAIQIILEVSETLDKAQTKKQTQAQSLVHFSDFVVVMVELQTVVARHRAGTLPRAFSD